MNEWLTEEEVVEEYGVDFRDISPHIGDRLRIQRVQGQPTRYSRTDIEVRLATQLEHKLDGWATYSELWTYHGVKRGWLDALVANDRVRIRDTAVGVAYSVLDILRELKDNSKQNPLKVPKKGRR